MLKKRDFPQGGINFGSGQNGFHKMPGGESERGAPKIKACTFPKIWDTNKHL